MTIRLNYSKNIINYLIKTLLFVMKKDNIIKIFENIEKEKCFKLPLNFKKIITESFEIYHAYLYRIIENIDNLEKRDKKILQLKRNYNKMEE